MYSATHHTLLPHWTESSLRTELLLNATLYHLAQCLAHRSSLINVCGINKLINEALTAFFSTLWFSSHDSFYELSLSLTSHFSLCSTLYAMCVCVCIDTQHTPAHIYLCVCVHIYVYTYILYGYFIILLLFGFISYLVINNTLFLTRILNLHSTFSKKNLR